MRSHEATLLGAIIVAILGHVISPTTAVSSQTSSPIAARRDSEELERIREKDQSDRAVFAADGLHTANDYLRSALILQHGEAPE